MPEGVKFTKHAMERIKERFPEMLGFEHDFLKEAVLYEGWKEDPERVRKNYERNGALPDVYIWKDIVAFVLLGKMCLTVAYAFFFHQKQPEKPPCPLQKDVFENYNKARRAAKQRPGWTAGRCDFCDGWHLFREAKKYKPQRR